MSVLSTLDIAADIDHANVDPVIAARSRLMSNLGEQLKAAEGLCLRVGNKRLALKGNNTNIVVGDDKALPETIQVCMKAVEAGELDKVIDKIIKARKPISKKS